MLPLDNVRVLDFSQATFGPLCGRLLGDLGADVIKVEPLEGDFSRLTPVPGADSVNFLINNRSKRSIALNLREERGREIAVKLAQNVDVVVQTFRKGVMTRLGLDYESIRRANPRVVYLSGYMYGETGPLSHLRGGDVWAQAFTGMVASQGSPEGPPYLVGHAIVDTTGAALNALAILVALHMRDRTGQGQEISTNLVSTGLFLQEVAFTHYLMYGTLFTKGGRGHARGTFPYGAYPAEDGDVVTIFGQDDDEWKTLCSILQIEHLLGDSRYDTQQKRNEARFELYPVLDQAFRQKGREEWQRLFQERGLRCDPCLDYAELAAHPQFAASDLVVELDHPREGRMKMLDQPISLKGLPAFKPIKPPPVLGEHTKEILMWLGYTELQIDELRRDGVVRAATPDMFQRTGPPKGSWSAASATHRRRRQVSRQPGDK